MSRSLEKLYSVVTPIFDAEIGHRLSIARQKMMLRQSDLARFLGVSQKAISRIESGRQKTLENPFTLAKLQAVLGPHIGYVLFGSNKERYDERQIRLRFWEVTQSKDPEVRRLIEPSRR